MGDPSYTNVVDFETAWMRKKAKEFTDVYVRSGKTDAARFSAMHIPPEKRAKLKVFVQEEFKKRGIEL